MRWPRTTCTWRRGTPLAVLAASTIGCVDALPQYIHDFIFALCSIIPYGPDTKRWAQMMASGCKGNRACAAWFTMIYNDSRGIFDALCCLMMPYGSVIVIESGKRLWLKDGEIDLIFRDPGIHRDCFFSHDCMNEVEWSRFVSGVVILNMFRH